MEGKGEMWGRKGIGKMREVARILVWTCETWEMM